MSDLEKCLNMLPSDEPLFIEPTGIAVGTFITKLRYNATRVGKTFRVATLPNNALKVRCVDDAVIAGINAECRLPTADELAARRAVGAPGAVPSLRRAYAGSPHETLAVGASYAVPIASINVMGYRTLLNAHARNDGKKFATKRDNDNLIVTRVA